MASEVTLPSLTGLSSVHTTTIHNSSSSSTSSIKHHNNNSSRSGSYSYSEYNGSGNSSSNKYNGSVINYSVDLLQGEGIRSRRGLLYHGKTPSLPVKAAGRNNQRRVNTTKGW
jgi:hypothetical protein